MNKRGSLHLLAEAYKQVGKQVIAEEQAPLLQPVKGRYIYFVDGNELYQLKPYKQIQPEGMIMAMANNCNDPRLFIKYIYNAFRKIQTIS